MNNFIRFKYLILLFLFFCIVNTPIQATNKNIYLNGTWHFQIDPNNRGIENKWYSETTDVTKWATMEVPSNWDIENQYANYAGKAWYSRTFFVDKSISEKMTRIIFESVYNDAIVWINGQKVGENHLGFLSFSFNINKYLKYGQENRITLMADNTFKRGALWNWGGIRRPVWLETTEKTRLEYMHITAIPNLEKGNADITIQFDLSNSDILNHNLDYELTILNAKKEVIFTKNDKLYIAASENKKVTTPLILPKGKVNLWHFESPHLYTCKIKLLKEGKSIHELEDRFGIRKVEVKGETFLLNGEIVKTVGFNLVAEDRVTGNTLPMWRIMEDIDLMKSTGANMARISHQLLPKSFLDYLDEKGIMTFEEVGLWGKDDMVDPNHPTPKEWMERMVKEKYNHPSIIGWSVGNEIGHPDKNPKIKEYVVGAIKHAKNLDNTRLAVYVTNTAPGNKDDATIYSDLIMLNKYDSWGAAAAKTHVNFPGKPIFYSEFGKEIISEDPNLGIVDVSNMLSQMREKPYIIGASYWTFNDYRSSYSNTPPSGNRSWGVVTTTREKKRAYNQFRKEYAPITKLQVNDYNNVTIVPRRSGDIPSYILKGYKLVWQGLDANNQLVDGGFHTVKDITPGDQPLDIKLSWNNRLDKFSSIKITLISGLNYSVADTTVFLVPPAQPQILGVHTDAMSARVVFKQSQSATSYKIKYTDNKNIVKETDETINNFIEVTDLKFEEKYKMELIALNNKGESKSQLFFATTSSSEKPPIVWAAIGDDNSCNISFSSMVRDYMYQIQYREVTSEYDENRYVQVSHRGMAKVNNLKEGIRYFFRIRRIMEWGFPSDWSHDIEVMTTKRDVTNAPTPIGIIIGKGSSVLSFSSPQKADGYIVRITDKKTQTAEEKIFRGSKIDFIYFDKQLPSDKFSVSIASTLDGKESEFKNIN